MKNDVQRIVSISTRLVTLYKNKKSFNYNILKINKNKLLLINKYKLNAILQILRDNKKEFLVKKEKL